ncbi:hypothetical protein [Thiomonas sp.]
MVRKLHKMTIVALAHKIIRLIFAVGDNRKIAVKIIDGRGIESLKVMGLESCRSQD